MCNQSIGSIGRSVSQGRFLVLVWLVNLEDLGYYNSVDNNNLKYAR